MAMSTISKLVFFSVIVIFSILGKSCRQVDTDVIPDVYVDFTIDLQDPEFSGLMVSGSFDTIDANTRNWGERAAGYGGNGIIVYAGAGDFFRGYFVLRDRGVVSPVFLPLAGFTLYEYNSWTFGRVAQLVRALR